MTTLADLTRWLDGRYPPASAESWDRVGVVCGAPEDPVTSVLLSVDVTTAVVAEAADSGADLLIAHHPLLLRGVHGIDGRQPKGRMLLDLIRGGIGCLAAHTNADIATDGVCRSLAEGIGLTALTPLDPRPAALDQVVVFVPVEHTAAVVAALGAAGAGTIGDYDHCHWSVPGTGSFRPLPGAQPFLGRPGVTETVAEDRVEMVLPRGRRAAVRAALLAAHPYEEPAYHFLELAPGPTDLGIGLLGELAEPLSADAFAAQVAAAVPPTVPGVRLGGDPTRQVRTVAVLAGAGDSHLDAAQRAGVDAYVTSDLRHHPATEALEYADAPVLIDVPHWAAEALWLPRLRALLAADFPELRIRVSEVRTDAWTRRYPG
ncbi:Nif3-like dinuclear metal center hexameric protein [Granulicoccus phenolivorans]|uniref:Nif3-like dinuclear metal center hexameric protein n=1 Tax=Granulicoccus phenolivorans TaxID=266854 RepID=UPI0003FEAFA8|nr:Nif3-like dinuclear metal center hexameric protein [Granulicoccus phenolivorans]